MNMSELHPLPFRISKALDGHPEVGSYINGLLDRIDRQQKEIEWKDMVIELTGLKLAEAEGIAVRATALNDKALEALNHAIAQLKAMQAEIHRINAEMGDGT